MKEPQSHANATQTGGPSKVAGPSLTAARILALETSGREASAAALEADGDHVRLVDEIAFVGRERTAQVLAPGTRDLLERAGWTPGDVQLVAVAVGPGSFTGLRIGVTMAKTFAYAVGAQIVGVHTLAVLAEQAERGARPLWTVMDAQRQELFAARFLAGGDLLHEVDTRIVPEAGWLATLRPGDFVTGPALRKLAARLPAGVAAAEDSRWCPMARSVGILGWRAYRAGRRDDVWQLVPQYYRLSAAEEKKTRRQGDKETRS